MFYKTNLNFNEPLKPRPRTKYIVIHHTEMLPPHSVECVHRWHQEKGWAGIGYHYYIRRNGDIFQSRPRDTQGAHVKVEGHAYNSESVGVCFEGDFRTETLPDKQLEASILLLSILNLMYRDSEFRTHHELDGQKVCPGGNFPVQRLLQKVQEQKQRFIDLYGDPKVVDYSFLLKSLEG